MSMFDTPLSASDLKVVADAAELVEKHSSELLANPSIGRIEICRPDGDDVIGYMAPIDDRGWFGFIPDDGEG